jgi:hypothetical protein
MMKKNKLFLALLFVGALNIATVKPSAPATSEFEGDLADDDDNNNDDDTTNQIMRLPQTGGFTYWSIQGFGGQFGGLAAKTIFAVGGDIVSRFDVFKSARVIKLERIHDSLKQEELTLTQAKVAYEAIQKQATEAQTALSKTQKEHADVTMLLDLTKAPTAREIRLKKKLDEETLISNTRFAKEQARYQEVTREHAESKSTSDAYETAIKKHRLFVGKDNEERKTLSQTWIAALGQKEYFAKEESLRADMREALKLNDIQIALDRMDTKKRQEKELKKRGLKADENGVLIRERQLSMHEQEDDTEEEFSEQQLEREKQYDAVREHKIQELTKQLAFKPCTDSRALDSK